MKKEEIEKVAKSEKEIKKIIKKFKILWGEEKVCSNTGLEECFCQAENVQWIPSWKYHLLEKLKTNFYEDKKEG